MTDAELVKNAILLIEAAEARLSEIDREGWKGRQEPYPETRDAIARLKSAVRYLRIAWDIV